MLAVVFATKSELSLSAFHPRYWLQMHHASDKLADFLWREDCGYFSPEMNKEKPGTCAFDIRGENDERLRGCDCAQDASSNDEDSLDMDLSGDRDSDAESSSSSEDDEENDPRKKQKTSYESTKHARLLDMFDHFKATVSDHPQLYDLLLQRLDEASDEIYETLPSTLNEEGVYAGRGVSKEKHGNRHKNFHEWSLSCLQHTYIFTNKNTKNRPRRFLQL
jgi:hypothetical protein